MRGIKFRAWDTAESKFWHFTLQDVLERRMHYRGSWDEKILKGEKTQYTGCKDINGKEIYEKDIVRIIDGTNTEWIEPVIFKEGFYGTEEESLCDSISMWNGVEVLGNVYENSELLQPIK